MRPKRSFNKFLNRETVLKPAEQLISDLLNLDSNTKEPANLNLKIDCLVNFLNNIRIAFSNTNNTEEKLKLENELIKYNDSISYTLISFLIQINSSVLRLVSLRLILFLAHFNKINRKLQEFKVNIYIVRLIDLDLSHDDTSLAIEYIRLLVQLYPNCLDESIVYCLLASLEDSKYKLNNIILETLLEIASKQPKLACKCQMFTELINYVVNVCNDNEFCIETVIHSLIKLLDKQEFRDQIKFDDLFRNLIAPFVDYDYVPLLWGTEYSSHQIQNFSIYSTTQTIETNQNTNELHINEILSSCSYALLTLMNSYSGLMCFISNDYQLLRDLISPLSWFLKSNKRDFLDKELNQLSTSSSFQSYQSTVVSSKKLTQIQQIIASQLVVINNLIDFLYKLFKIDEINIRDVLQQNKRKYSNLIKMQSDLLNDDDFINTECDDLFGIFDDYEFQLKSYEAVENSNDLVVSSGPNLNICFRAFLLKSFIEVGLFESLLDLYYGLPVSFRENNFNYSRLNMNSNYQNLSLRCLHLFANLYYLANNLFNNEYCIDNFNELRNLDTSKFYNKGIYTELKKVSLVSYLKRLDDAEREKEVIFYLTEFITKKESFKNGSNPPTEQLTRLSFYAQQFLSHAGFLSSNKFEIELEILNLTTMQHIIQNSRTNESNVFSSLMSEFEDRREAKKALADLEKRIEEQIDQTLVLQVELNISTSEHKQVHEWNWFEIIKLFELYLLTSSSMQPRFSPTQDALTIASNKKFQNEKLTKCISKLFNFFSLNKDALSNITLKNTQSSNSTRLSVSYHQTVTNQSDLILCSGCYLIDFALSQFNIDNYLNRSDASRYFSPYEYSLIQLLQNIKSYLTIEFLPSVSNHKRNASTCSIQSRFISKDSLVSYYVLLIGHLSGSELGDRLLDSFKFYDLLVKIIETTKDVSIMRLVCSSLNYYISIKSRTILEKCLSLSYSNELIESDLFVTYCEFKIYALKLLFNIYRACTTKFEAFFIDIIISSIISNYLLDVTFEKQMTQIDLTNQFILELSLNLLVYFLNQRPDLTSSLLKLNSLNSKIDQLKKIFIENDRLKQRVKNYNLLRTKVKLILNRLLLSKDTLDKMSVQTMKQLLNDWDESKMDFKYYQIIERNAFNLNAINRFYCEEYDDRVAFSTDQNEEQRDSSIKLERFVKLYRRINDSNKNNNLYSGLKIQSIPVHINSILIRSKCFISNQYYISDKFEKKIIDYIELILRGARLNSDCKQIDDKNLKAALWSICSLLNSEIGFKYLQQLNSKRKMFLNLFHLSSSLVRIAESYGNLSVRTTGFLCLNLVSKTCTGANLIGKIGWHTFQPNKFTETKAFYSVLSSFSMDEQVDFNYSPIDTALTLYNLNRFKTNLNLNLMNIYDSYEFTKNEKQFLEEQNKIDLMHMSDKYFIKSEDNLYKIGFFHDNITVPMKQSLMAVKNGLNQSEINNKQYVDDYETEDQVKHQIVSLILKLTPVVNLDKVRVSLSKLKQQHSNKFDLSLHNYVSLKILCKHKFKFHFRRYIQELFYEIS